MIYTSKQKVELFLQRIEAELQKQKMTLPELAEKMGRPKSRYAQLYRWMWGEQIMSLKAYYEICEALGIPDGLNC